MSTQDFGKKLQNKNLLNHEEGIGLVEIILAFGVSIIVMVALVSLATFTLRAASTSSRMMQGTRLANQELEILRSVRDSYSSWNDFYNVVHACSADTACVSESCYVTLSTSQISNGAKTSDDITVCFGSREVAAGTLTDTSRIDIIAVATWTIGGQRKYVHNYTRLTDWNN
jgi:hypothetical protein